MAKTSVTKSTVEDVAAIEVSDVVVDAVEKMNEDNKKNAKKSIDKNSLNDADEIEVVSLIPNVSYKDSKTEDIYEWDKVGHVEYMTFETLKNMWRTNKGYFRNMWLKPNDDRVIEKFGLAKVFEKYEYLMNESNYIKKNVDFICDAISDTPNSLKFAICNKIKDFAVSGKVTDAYVLKALEKHLKIDLIEFI